VSCGLTKQNLWNECNDAIERNSEWGHLLIHPFMHGTNVSVKHVVCDGETSRSTVCGKNTVARMLSPLLDVHRSQEGVQTQKTGWFWRNLRMKLTRFQLVKAIRPNDNVKRYTFCSHISNKTLLGKLVYSHEATVNLSAKIKKENIIIWGTEQPHSTIQHVRESANVNVLLSTTKV
jgi:hypothetical protein